MLWIMSGTFKQGPGPGPGLVQQYSHTKVLLGGEENLFLFLFGNMRRVGEAVDHRIRLFSQSFISIFLIIISAKM